MRDDLLPMVGKISTARRRGRRQPCWTAGMSLSRVSIQPKFPLIMVSQQRLCTCFLACCTPFHIFLTLCISSHPPAECNPLCRRSGASVLLLLCLSVPLWRLTSRPISQGRYCGSSRCLGRFRSTPSTRTAPAASAIRGGQDAAVHMAGGKLASMTFPRFFVPMLDEGKHDFWDGFMFCAQAPFLPPLISINARQTWQKE